MLQILFKNSAVYAVGIILSRLVGFLMIPVYTRVLTPSDYGVIETIVRLVDILSILLALGMSEALLRHYHEVKDERERQALVSTTLILMVGVIIAGILLLQPIIPGLTYLLFGNLDQVPYVRVALVGMMIGNLIPLPLTLFRAEGKAWRFTVISLLQLIFQLTLNIIFVVWLQEGVWGVVLSILINGVFWSTVLILYVLSSVGWKLEGRWIPPLFKYGLPLVPAALAQFLLHFSDRFFLVHYTSTTEIGLYSLAYRLGMLGSEMFNALNWAWWPWVFRVASRSNAEKELQKGASLVLVLSALICAGVSLFADPIIRLIAAPSFWKAAPYVPVLSLAYWFFTATTPLSISARLAKRTDLFAVANALAAGACLLFNFWLIPRYQVWGAITATLASFILLVALVLYACRRIAPFKHNWNLITLSILGLCVTAWWSNWIHVPEPFALLCRGMIWLGMAAGLLFCFVRLYSLHLENSPLFPRILSWVKMNGNL